MQKKIIIIGGGFAGIYAARAIARAAGKDAEVTIINRTNSSLFTPMLHEVATGGLGHHQVVESVREIIRGLRISIREAEVLSVDLAVKNVLTDRGEIPYDMLVFAQGATTNFFNTPGAQAHSLVLKDLRDAISIRNSIIDAFEKAATEPDQAARERLLSFTVVGGGATGVESAVEIAEFSSGTLRKYYSGCRTTMPRITLVQSAPELLPMFKPKVRARALKVLKRQGVQVLLNTKVSEVGEDGILLSSGERVQAGMVLWTAGVMPNRIAVTGGELPLDPGGRILTDQAFAVLGYGGVFAIGDAAHVDGFGERGLPMLAQVATREAKQLGINIARIMKGKQPLPFSYRSKGELVSLGRWQAAGTIFGITIHGKLAWFIWRTVYLFKFNSGAKRLRIAFDWTLQLFYPRDITRA
jgi:NADH dehydrogenase